MKLMALVFLALAVTPAAGLSAGAASQAVLSVDQRSSAASTANPIRRVVTLLQSMSKKIEEEQAKDESLWEKYQCYCKTNGASLQETIAAAETKLPQTSASIQETQSNKARLEQELMDHKAARDAAFHAIEEAHAIREKEAAEAAAESTEYKTNIDALSKAITAIEGGMGGSFLQTVAAQRLSKVVANLADIDPSDREVVMSFLSAGSGSSEAYAPQSGEILGILKEIKDEMEKSLAEVTSAEAAAKSTFDALMAAKEKEIIAHTLAIEDKSGRVGNAGVEIANMQADLSDTEKGLMEDKKFAEDIAKSCSDKEAEWKEISEVRQQELATIAETVKILNDDDALELFKKTLPSPSLVQTTNSAKALRSKVLNILRKAPHSRSAGLDLIALALTGKKVSFEKVLKMIDTLVETLKEEQQHDDSKKEYCEKQFDLTDDKEKDLSHGISTLELKIEDATEAISTLVEEIKALSKGIEALDKDVAEATATRKEEHSEYVELISSNSAAKELIGVAKNRLNKFYNPKLYVPPPKRELTREEQIYSNLGGELEPTPAPGGIAGTGVMAFMQMKSSAQGSGAAAPPPAPEAFGAYAKRSQESNGVIAMLDMLVADLDKEITEAETEEKNAQAAYETFMEDAAEKRAQDSKSITEKNTAKADSEALLQSSKTAKASKTEELMATEEYMSSLHGECDWLLKNFELRKSARAGEVDSLKAAKAVLAGADYSLVQLGRALRGGASSQ